MTKETMRKILATLLACMMLVSVFVMLPETLVKAEQEAEAEEILIPAEETGAEEGEAEEEPAVEEPAEEEPAAEEPVAEELVAEEPEVEEPVVEEPEVEEPVAEEPVAGEPAAEEPKVEEPVAEEPAAEEPEDEEPVAEEPVAEDPEDEEPVAEEPVVEDPVVEEPEDEEPVAEELVVEEPVAEEPEDEELAAEEPVVEEPVVEEPAVDAVVVEEPVTEEPAEEDADDEEILFFDDYETPLASFAEEAEETVVYAFERDENGELVLDEKGNPVAIVPEGAEIPVTYLRNENGELELDADGNPVVTQTVPADAMLIDTLEDALDPNRTIDLYYAWNDGEPVLGGDVTFIAVLYGYDNLEYTLQWQESADNENWYNVADATDLRYVETITRENYRDFWRVQVIISGVRE